MKKYFLLAGIFFLLLLCAIYFRQPEESTRISMPVVIPVVPQVTGDSTVMPPVQPLGAPEAWQLKDGLGRSIWERLSAEDQQLQYEGE